jgi:CspA family cold shock protein
MKLKGICKWFNSAKGYGFLTSADEERDIFVHYSSIDMDGYKSLKEGQEVEFDLQEGSKGPTALAVRKLTE